MLAEQEYISACSVLVPGRGGFLVYFRASAFLVYVCACYGKCGVQLLRSEAFIFLICPFSENTKTPF